MQTRDFSFNLPEGLIAQFPEKERGTSRLLVLERESGAITHSQVTELQGFLPANSLLVFNNSRVRKARLHAATSTGGNVEVLLLKKLSPTRWEVMTDRMARQKKGRRLLLPEGIELEIAEELPDRRIVEANRVISEDWLDRHGHMPLPPYIRRDDIELDSSRYQTVYADATGSAAAPTAGLHFTKEILIGLEEAGMELCFISLHVGLGTFLPVRTDRVEDHRMHTEDYSIPLAVAETINSARAEGRPVIAVGTTSLRCLESSFRDGRMEAGEGSTEIFIYPGYSFNVVDGLFTNFHTPLSSLLMLVSAFAGREKIMAAYEEAVQKEYRFFSYGDAMLII